MSKQKLKHIRSAVAGKSPTPEQLDYGVIAVNFNAEEPFLSIKDSNDQIAKFPSEAAISGVISGQVESVVEEVLPTVVGENYPTKTEVNDEINALSAATDTKLEQKANVSDIPSLDGYATENWVQEQGYLTEHQSLDGYATEQWVTDQHYLTEHQDISGLATKQELSEGLSGKSNTGHTHTVSDITNFPTIPSATSDLTNDSGFITSGYTYSKTESDDKYALKGDVPTDVYTKTETDEAINGATQDMATKTWVGEQGYLTEHQSLDNYYTKQQVDAEVSGATEGLATETWVQNQGYLTEHQDISNLATKQEVNDLSGATDTKLAGKQDTLVAGENITISGNTISASGGGSEYTAGTNMEITSGNTINCTIPVNTGTNNSYQDDLLFGTGINIGTNKRRIGIGRNIVFSDKISRGSVAISPGWDSDDYNQKSHIYGASAISIGRRCDIGEGDSLLNKQGDFSIAIGNTNHVHNRFSIAIGNNCTCTSNAEFATAIGYDVKAASSNSFNCGVYNIGQTDTLFELGNGTSTSARSNAVEVKNNGDVYIKLDGQMVKLQDHLGGGGSITIDPALDPTSSNAVANSAITESLSAKFDASGITDYYTSTEVDNAISAATSTKQDILVAGEGISISGNTISATGGGGGGGMTEDTELLLATAITDLNDRKIDAKEVNARFQKKGSYVTTSVLNTRLSQYETALDEQNVEEVAAYALNDLNSRKQDKLIAGEGISISGNTISATGGGGGGTTYTAGDGISISGTTISAVPDASITSGSTNSVQSAAIYTQFDGMQLKKITQADYDLLPTKDSNTLYIITNSN